MKVLFLGETFRADAQSWIKGIEKYSNTRLYTLEIPLTKHRITRLLYSVFFIYECLKTHFSKPYDITLAERSTSYGFSSLFVNTRLRVVAQQGISDIYPPTLFSRVIKSFLKKLAYRGADIIHAWGPAMVYAQLKNGAHPKKIIVKPKGINLKLYKYRQFGTDKINKIIVTRSLESDYRHVDIIDAVKIAKEKYSIDLYVTIVGGGSLLEFLKTRVEYSGLSEQINFLGRINNEQLPKILEEHAIYLSVPVTEGVSSSLMEAMAVGCLPIVTDLPGNRPFIKPGFNGELVKVGNPEDIAEKLHKAISNYQLYINGINYNRLWIEKNADFDVNMKYFYESYLNKLKEKCAE